MAGSNGCISCGRLLLRLMRLLSGLLLGHVQSPEGQEHVGATTRPVPKEEIEEQSAINFTVPTEEPEEIDCTIPTVETEEKKDFPTLQQGIGGIPEPVKKWLMRTFIILYILAFIITFSLIPISPNIPYIINICLCIGAMIGVFVYLLKGVCDVRRASRSGRLSWVSPRQGSVPEVSVNTISRDPEMTSD